MEDNNSFNDEILINNESNFHEIESQQINKPIQKPYYDCLLVKNKCTDYCLILLLTIFIIYLLILVSGLLSGKINIE